LWKVAAADISMPTSLTRYFTSMDLFHQFVGIHVLFVTPNACIVAGIQLLFLDFFGSSLA